MNAAKLNHETFIEDKNFRNQYITKTEVLVKVKVLTLLPDNEFAEAREVANYYNVDVDTIRQIRNRHKDELESDGAVVISGEHFKSYKQKIALQGVTLLAKSNIALFTRRAILRIGMLLRDSEVAKQVRTYLLNIEQQSTKEQRQKAADFTGTWTPKEELILLDCIYNIVGNGGTVTEATKIASEKINHSQSACFQRYSTKIRTLISDEKILNNINNNKIRSNEKHDLKVLVLENKESPKNEDSTKLSTVLYAIGQLRDEIQESSNIAVRYHEKELQWVQKLNELRQEIQIKTLEMKNKEKFIENQSIQLERKEDELKKVKKKYFEVKKSFDVMVSNLGKLANQQHIVKNKLEKNKEDKTPVQNNSPSRKYILENGVPKFID